MARVPSEDIERLKREVSLERLAVAKGIQLERRGEELAGTCPFCGSEGRTLLITPETNLWRCDGACKAGGHVLDWVMKAEGVSLRLAVELLRDGNGAFDAFAAQKRGRQKGLVATKSTTTKLREIEHGADEQVLLRGVLDYYHDTLKQSPEALAFLEKRGLRSAEMVERFGLGFANRTLAYRLPQKNRQAGAEVRGRLQTLGVLRESGHEHFNGSLVIPVFDAEGRLGQAYGRKITPGLRAGTPLHLWLPGPQRGVWNLETLVAGRQVILCDSLLNALTFWCAGFRNVTATAGLDGAVDDHLAAFTKHGTEQVLIAFRRTPEGDRAAEKVAAHLGEAGVECLRVVFPKGWDANDFALKPAPGGFEALLRQAQWLGKGKAKPAAVEAPVPAPVADRPPSAAEAVTTATRAAAIEVGRGQPEPVRPRAPVATQPADPPPEAVSAATEADGSPASPEPVPATETTTNGDQVILRFGDRHWRVRGLAKNTGIETMKVNVLCSREGVGLHVDTLELYSARQRAQYVTMAAQELCVEEQVIKRDLGQVLLKLEELQEHAARKADDDKAARPKLSDEEREAALGLLRDPRLLNRILEDLDRCGIVGERTNKLVAYLAATSRLLDEPLAVVIHSSSAGGKSSLMEAVLALIPEEDRAQYSAMTGQSLFYLGEADLRHKVLAIVEQEGAERASYALKLLQSEGALTIASTGKDAATGRLVTQAYRVEGPVALMLTTTAIEVDEELLNRCVVLSVDEGREQTRAIHERQRAAQTLEGVLARQERQHLLKLHRDAQRLLRPVLVVNPFAQELSFLDHATRTRRDHLKYLTLIRTIALLHQHQRPMKTILHRGRRIEYVEVTREDITVANRLCHEVLGRSLDELPPQTRRLLGLLDEIVKAACARLGIERTNYRFSRREVREQVGWGNTQLKIHLARLVELEYVLVHRGRQGQGYVYELAYDGQGKDGAPFLPGLAVVVDRPAGDGGEASPPGRGTNGNEAPVAAIAEAAVPEAAVSGHDDAMGAPVGREDAAEALFATLDAEAAEEATGAP